MRHILLVDDEPEVLEGLLLILDKIPNVIFHSAQLASQAMQIIESFPVSLVIADIHMPGMNGIEMWETINRRFPYCKVIFLSGVRDFDNIYRVIQSPNAKFLTKMEPAEKIHAVVMETLKELDHQDDQKSEAQRHAFFSCLTSGDSERHRMMARFTSTDGPICIEKGIGFACFNICHAWAMTIEEQRDSMTHLSSKIPEQINNVETHFLRIDNCYAVLLFQACAHQANVSLKQELTRICEHAEKSTGISFQCIYETDIYSLDTLITCYREASEYGKYIYLPQTDPLSLSQIKAGIISEQKASYKRIDFLLQMLESFLLLGQKENFCKLTTQIFDDCMKPVLYADMAMYVYFRVLAILYKNLSSEKHADLLDKLKCECVWSPVYSHAWHDARKKLIDDCQETFDTLYPPDPYAQSEMISSMQRYIQEHLSQDLSLNVLSSRFNLNPNYLSRFFRENTGYKLHDYITELRLGTAERLLCTSNMRINEIAAAVGYDSAHTFIRAFRRHFSDSPAEYRSKKAK